MAGHQLHLTDATVAAKPVPEGCTASGLPSHTIVPPSMLRPPRGVSVPWKRGGCDLELPPQLRLKREGDLRDAGGVNLHSRYLDNVEGHRVWILVMEEQLQIQHLETYIQVQALAHHSCVTLALSLDCSEHQFSYMELGVVQVEEGCEARAPHVLPVGVETGTFVWRVICTLYLYTPLEPAIHF